MTGNEIVGAAVTAFGALLLMAVSLAPDPRHDGGPDMRIVVPVWAAGILTIGGAIGFVIGRVGA